MDHDSALDDKQVDADSDRLKAVHERAMKRFDTFSVQADMRAASLAARRFISIPGAQWDGDWGEQFAESIKVEIDMIGNGVRKIEGDYRENRIVPDFRPDGDRADPDTANTLDGLHRADSYRFKSQQARDNAFFEAVAGGFGAYRLTNEWEDESDKDNDNQRVNPGSLIVDADQSVFFDLNARMYDKSDARFAFIRTALSCDAFEEEYPEAATDFPAGATWNAPEWFSGLERAVAEYYEVEERDETLWVLTYTLSGEVKRFWASELEDGQLAEMVADGWMKKAQRRKRKRVHKYVLSGAEVLEDRGLIAGDAIPIVPVYGKRYFVEGMERWQGFVQPKMDAQRLYNSNVSRLAEINSMAPREVPIFLAEQMPPHLATQWAEMNIKRHPFALVEAVRDSSGEIVASGPVSTVKPPTLPEVTAALLQIAKSDLTEDMNDGAGEVRANTSAEAMDIAATRVDAKSGIYLDNMRQSVQREGEIYLGMAGEVYIEKGRKVETMTEDGDDGRAVLKEEYTDQDGAPKIRNDLQEGRYKVIATVTEATATRRDKTVKAMLRAAEVAITAQDMEIAQAAILTALSNMDGEGIDEFLAWCRKKGLNLGLFEPNDDEKKAMEDAAQNAEPDPMAKLAEAQGQQLVADAAKKVAEVEETKADTENTRADTIVKLAEAAQKRRELAMPVQPKGVN